jgi:hypothetical protein
MMSEPNDQISQAGEPTASPRSVLQDIDQLLEDGMPVFDLNGEFVGGVKAYTTAAGYLMVGSASFEHTDLYVPFRLIQSIDPQGLSLSEPKDVLAAQYAEPPSIKTIVENRFEPGPHGDALPQAFEVRVVQSGYDSTLKEVGSVELGDVAERLSVGLVVYDSDGVRLGDIAQYDVRRRLLVIEKGIFKPTVIVVPFSAISRIDRDKLSIYLVLPKADLLKEQARLPDDN